MTTDQRHLTPRRRADIITLGVLTAACAVGVAWGTATAALSQKLDRAEFQQHVIRDSLRSVSSDAALRRIETKLDSTNERLFRLICNNKPLYCR